MLTEAEARTQQEKEEMEGLEGVRMIAPTIQREKNGTHPQFPVKIVCLNDSNPLACETNLRAKLPAFKQCKHEDDLFQGLGPTPFFNAENQWIPPRTILLLRVKGSFGIFVRGSQPVMVSGVDENGPAEVGQLTFKLSDLSCC